MLPLYAHVLSPADFGVWGLVGTVSNAASLGLMFGLYAAAGRLYFGVRDEADRRQLFASIFWFLTIVPAVLLVASDHWVGAAFARQLPAAPYVPYLRAALWIGYLSNFALLPTTLFRNQERPGALLRVTLPGTALQVGLVLVFVLQFHWGLRGALYAWLLANLAMAFVYSVLLFRTVGFSVSAPALRTALVFSLPFWPHALAGWVLNLSDRAILSRLLPLEQVGIYALGFQFAQVLRVAIEAANQAWAPFFFEREQQSRGSADTVRVATYFVAATSCLCLFSALEVGPVLRLLTPPTFWAAERVAFIVALGFTALAPYYVGANAVMQSKRVAAFPVITIVAGIVSVAMNLLLVRRFGILAAAWASLCGNVLLAAGNCLLAHRVYPLAHEYVRWAKVLGASLLVAGIGRTLQFSNAWVEAVARLPLLLVWLALLRGFGFLQPDEREQLRRVLRARRAGGV